MKATFGNDYIFSVSRANNYDYAVSVTVGGRLVNPIANGSTYTGSWADGQRSGSGTVNYANGDQFSGSFAADLRDGSGTYTWANGTTYRGTWKAGEARKGGTYSYTDAGVKEGLSAGGNLTMQD